MGFEVTLLVAISQEANWSDIGSLNTHGATAMPKLRSWVPPEARRTCKQPNFKETQKHTCLHGALGSAEKLLKRVGNGA